MIHAETDAVLSVQREGQIKEVHSIHVPPDERVSAAPPFILKSDL